MRVERLDHLVLTVRDIATTVAFHTRVLGMQPVTFADGRTALAFGAQKLNLHQAGAEFEPEAERPTPGSADLCFVVSDDMDAIAAELRAAGVAILEGPVQRSGALGPITSLYFRDPDGNLLEVSRDERSPAAP
jgi:catechol 2,3-dioxygenase-like lactoylglutathione lyase family enzyme